MEKRPGCDAVYYIYDKGERLVFSQDGEQRGRGEWTFTIPDVFGRTLLKGVCKNMFYYDDYPFINIVTEAKRTNASNSLYGHTVSGVTLNNATLHGVNFYDDYAFIGKNGVPTSLNYATPPSGYGTRYTGGYKGLLTGTVTARLDRRVWQDTTTRLIITITAAVSSRRGAQTIWAERMWSMSPITSSAIR